MVENPLVSIVCNTYNHENFIRDAIEGFLMQKTTFPFEILIHDDASTDGTTNIVKEYEQKYPEVIRPIYQKENKFSRGIKINLNYQFPRVRGKYTALCEGDDYWTDPFKLQNQLDFLKKNPEYSMCFHNAKIIAPPHLNYREKLFDHLKERDYSGLEILQKWTIPTASVVFRNEFNNALINIHQHPDYMYYDIITFLTLAECGKIYCINKKMSVYRIHASSMTNSKENIENNIKFIKHHKAIQKSFDGKYKYVTDKIIAKNYLFIGIRLIKKKQILKALINLLNSFRFYVRWYLCKK